MKKIELKQIKKERESIQRQLQADYDALSSYEEKFNYIYDCLIKSQSMLLHWKNDNTFNDEYYQKLKVAVKKITNDSDFVDFIETNITNLIPSDHVSLTSNNIIVNKPVSNIHEQTYNNSGNASFTILPDKPDTVILKIDKFISKYVKQDAYLYQNLKEYLDTHDISNIIIDIRGNGGGSDEYFSHFSVFTDEDVDYQSNVYDLFMNEVLTDDISILKGCDKHYNKCLLVNQEVFSTSDKLARICKQTGYATVIGKKTKGEGYGFTPFQLQIMNGAYLGQKAEQYYNKGAVINNICVRFPTEVPLNENGEIDFNIYCTTPDIETQSEMALSTALAFTDEKQTRKVR